MSRFDQRPARERRLEGPGSDKRLRRLNARFRAFSSGIDPVGRLRVDPVRIGQGLWLTVWASCVGGAVAVLMR